MALGRGRRERGRINERFDRWLICVVVVVPFPVSPPMDECDRHVLQLASVLTSCQCAHEILVPQAGLSFTLTYARP